MSLPISIPTTIRAVLLAVVSALALLALGSSSALAASNQPYPYPYWGELTPFLSTDYVQVGQTVTVNNGDLESLTPPVVTYQWIRCDSAANNCAPIPGATNASYVITKQDLNSILRTQVSVSNAATSAQGWVQNDAAYSSSTENTATVTAPFLTSDEGWAAINEAGAEGGLHGIVCDRYRRSSDRVVFYRVSFRRGTGPRVEALASVSYLLGNASNHPALVVTFSSRRVAFSEFLRTPANLDGLSK